MREKEFSPVTFAEEVKMLGEKVNSQFSFFISEISKNEALPKPKMMNEIKTLLGEMMRVLNVARYQKLRNHQGKGIQESAKDLGIVWTRLYPQLQNTTSSCRELANSNPTELAYQLAVIQNTFNQFLIQVQPFLNHLN